MYVMLPLIQWNLSDRIFFGRTGVLIRGGLLYIEFDLILTRLHCVLFYAVGVLSVWPLSKVWYQWFTLILVFFSLYPSPPPRQSTWQVLSGRRMTLTYFSPVGRTVRCTSMCSVMPRDLPTRPTLSVSTSTSPAHWLILHMINWETMVRELQTYIPCRKVGNSCRESQDYTACHKLKKRYGTRRLIWNVLNWKTVVWVSLGNGDMGITESFTYTVHYKLLTSGQTLEM